MWMRTHSQRTGPACTVTYRVSEDERVALLDAFGVRAFPSLLYPHKPGMAEWLNGWAREFAARTPLDRTLERGWRTGARALIEAVKAEGTIRDADHARDFLDCVKNRKTPSCDVEYGHRCTSAALIANLAHRTRSYLEWDPKGERFTNNEAANRMLAYEYRKPYALPS